MARKEQEHNKELFTGADRVPALPSSSHFTLRILLLEDNPTDAELIQQQLHLAQLQFALQRTETRAGFVRDLHTFTPTVILSDFSLPGFSALEALHHLRAQGLRLPFILVTGSQPEDVAVQCMKEGADDYILKDSLQRLPGAILNAVEKHAHTRMKEKAEGDLRQQRDMYETLLTAQSEAGLGFAVVSGQSQKILYVNDAFCRISGYAAGELLTLPSFFRLVARDVSHRLEACMRRKRPGQMEPDTLEAALINKLGNRVEIEVTVKQPRLDHDTRFIVIMRDISDRIRHEVNLKTTLAALREREEQLRLLFEGVKEYAIFMIDQTGRVVNWNNGAARLYGYAAGEITGRHYSTFYPQETSGKEKLQRSLILAKEKGKAEDEGWRVRKDGSRFWAGDVVSSLYNDDGKLVGFSTIVRDLTERKRVEDQLRQQGDDLRALTRHLQFVREEERFRISRELHDELGQVLTALRMDLSILQRRLVKTVEREEQGPLLEKISSMAQLVETTIQSVRRIVMELRPTVLDEFGLMTAIQWQAQEFETRTGIRCVVSRLQRDVDVNPNQATTLFRMLQEALTNVARHAHAKRVRVGFESKDQSFILTIEDDGSGIDQARPPGGTSFGLLGMQERARILGGRVDIHGERGKGTTITIRIPMQLSTESEGTRQP